MTAANVQLSTVATVLNGYAFKSSEYVESGIRIIRITNVQKGNVEDDNPKFISTSRNEEFSRFMLESGDILISLTGNVGRVAAIRESMLPAALNQRVGALKLKTNQIDPSYLFHILNSDDFEREAIKNSKGVAQLNLSSKWIENYSIPLPPLAEQKRIAAILDAADALRAKRRESLAQLDTLLQSTFLDLFGDPVTNPKGWDTKPLCFLGILDRGVSKHRPRNDPILLDGVHPLIQTGDVANSDGYIRNFRSTYSDLGLKQSKMWPAGTLCITIAANIANTGILTFDACFPDSVVGFKSAYNGRVEFVQGLFWFFREMLEKKAPQSAQKNINLKILRELQVPFPPNELQNRFATIVESIERQKSRLRAHLAELDTLFASLQSRAFNGEL